MNFPTILKITYLFLTVYLIIYLLNIFYKHKKELLEFTRLKEKPKVVLYWTNYFGSDNFFMGFGQNFQHCSYKNCFLTNNRYLLDIDEFDAIFFHGREYDPLIHGVPWKRSPRQIYVFYNLESPHTTYLKGAFENFYNWTITYRHDSDLVRPYGFIIKQKTNFTVPNFEDINRRKKQIAWFVSNCETPNKRKILANDINLDIPVDIYGKCGTLSCNADKINCYKMLEKNYKFYLSFENAHCPDYVTEKLFNILKLNIVPIVYGKADYDKIVPPNSIIDVSKFNNVTDLVNYIKRIDENVTEYLEYFQWKQDYVIDTSGQKFLCQLCDKLNQPIVNNVYSDISGWWNGKEKPVCQQQPPNIVKL